MKFINQMLEYFEGQPIIRRTKFTKYEGQLFSKKQPKLIKNIFYKNKGIK